MENIWIIVADTCRARIFKTSRAVAKLTELETLTNPSARLHEGDITSDRSGHVASSAAGGHDLGVKDDLKHAEADRFAAEICRRLEKGRVAKSFEKLYILAGPAFLGLLRKHVPSPLKPLICDEIAKQITTEPPDRIRAQLPEYL